MGDKCVLGGTGDVADRLAFRVRNLYTRQCLETNARLVVPKPGENNGLGQLNRANICRVRSGTTAGDVREGPRNRAHSLGKDVLYDPV